MIYVNILTFSERWRNAVLDRYLFLNETKNASLQIYIPRLSTMQYLLGGSIINWQGFVSMLWSGVILPRASSHRVVSAEQLLLLCNMKALVITMVVAVTLSTLTCLPLKDLSTKLLQRGTYTACILSALVYHCFIQHFTAWKMRNLLRRSIQVFICSF